MNNSQNKPQTIYEFLHNKKYDESKAWPNMTLIYKNNQLNANSVDGDTRRFYTYTTPLELGIREITNYRSETNDSLLEQLHDLYPEEFI